MSPVTVQKIKSPDAAASLFESMNGLFRDVQRKAFELFQERGCTDGRDVDDWLRAERSLVLRPESRLLETEKEFKLEMAMPNVEAKDIIISALPESIVVQAQTSRNEEKEGEVHFSEFRDMRLFRRFDLRPGIDVEQVKAKLESGMLTIVAVKLPEVKERKIPIAA
jgi:HSP20 family molecular chaperone IbpA